MSFLAPVFLAGLAAIAIPVIVHLTNRPKSEAYSFPSLMFLHRAPFRTVRRQRIRHWWLLALRAAVIVLLAGAFARPLLERLGGSAGAFAAGREVVMLLDNSYSMRAGDRWQRALSAAQRVVGGLGSDDRATVVLFGDRAISLGQATGDHATLLAELAGAGPGFGATRYAAGLQLAREILEQSDLPRRQVVLVSDFQRAGWRPGEGIRLPTGAAVEAVDLSQPATANVAVTGMLVERAYRGSREQATISARVANLAAVARRGVRVSLDVDGRTVQTVTVNLEPKASAAALFSALPLSDRPVQVTAKAAPDQLPVDDNEYAVLAPGDVVRVLVLSSGSGASGGLFLQRALQVSGSPRFDVTVASIESVRPAALDGYAVVVLADAAPGSTPLVGRFAEWVRRGGGALVLLGSHSAAGAWGSAWRALMGGAPGPAVEPATGGGAALAGLQYDHPVFEPFGTPRSGDFGSARVYRYRRFDPDSAARVLARYDDGAAALVEQRQGVGKVLTWTSGMDNVWTDLPVQPVFLPLVHQMVRYLAGYVERPAAFTVGHMLNLEAARELVGGGSELSVESPAGRRVALGVNAQPGLSLDEPGFYTLRALDPDLAPRSVAVNVDPVEADLTPLDVDAFLAAIGPAESGAAAGVPGTAPIGPAERERRQGLWWYLVIGAAVLALAETFLSNRLPAMGRAGSTS